MTRLRCSADAVVRIEGSDPRRDLCAPIAPLRAIALVAEPMHQLDERAGDPPRVPAGRAGGLGEPVAGQRRCDDMERVTVRASQPWDDVLELDDGTGPPVRDDQRERVVARRARVDEVDRLAVDPSAEVLELVQPRLLSPPVVRVTPVLDQLAHVSDRDPVLPARAVDLIREAGPLETAAEVLQDRVLDVDVELLDRVAQGITVGSVSQPRTVDVGASRACSRSTSHSGNRCKTSSSATRPSRRASAAPRQKWTP